MGVGEKELGERVRGGGVGMRKKCLQADCSNKTPNLNSRTNGGGEGVVATGR